MRKQEPNALTRQIQRADKGERFRNSGRWWCCGAASANRGGRKQDDGDPSATHIRTSCAAGGGVANATPRSPRLQSPGDRLSRPPPPLHAPAPKPRPRTRAARFWVTPGAGGRPCRQPGRPSRPRQAPAPPLREVPVRPPPQGGRRGLISLILARVRVRCSAQSWRYVLVFACV